LKWRGKLGEQTVPSGITALLVADSVALAGGRGLARPGGVRPVPRVTMGLLMGFAGMALLVGPSAPGRLGARDPWGAAVLVVASLAWDCGSIYSKHGECPVRRCWVWRCQSFAGGVILLIVALITGEFENCTLARFGSLLAGTCLPHRIRVGHRLQRLHLHHSPKHCSAREHVCVVNPVVALFLGWLIAGETITLRTVLAAAVILTAVILVITAPHPTSAPVTATVPALGRSLIARYFRLPPLYYFAERLRIEWLFPLALLLACRT